MYFSNLRKMTLTVATGRKCSEKHCSFYQTKKVLQKGVCCSKRREKTTRLVLLYDLQLTTSENTEICPEIILATYLTSIKTTF